MVNFVINLCLVGDFAFMHTRLLNRNCVCIQLRCNAKSFTSTLDFEWSQLSTRVQFLTKWWHSVSISKQKCLDWCIVWFWFGWEMYACLVVVFVVVVADALIGRLAVLALCWQKRIKMLYLFCMAWILSEVAWKLQ